LHVYVYGEKLRLIKTKARRGANKIPLNICKGEVKMYCSNCNYPLESTAEQCPNCANPVAMPAEDIANNYQEEAPGQENEHTGEYAEEGSPEQPANEYASVNDASEGEEPVYAEMEASDVETSDGEASEGDATEPAQVPSSNLNYMEKKARKLILEQEIAALKCCIQPLLDEIASLASQADSEAYEPSIDSIAAKVGEARAVDAEIKAKEEEYRNLIVNPCCEQGFYDADRFCGVCGEGLGETGWLCTNCQTRNKDSNNYCRGCGSASETAPLKQCSNPDCENDDPECCKDDECPFCGWPIL